MKPETLVAFNTELTKARTKFPSPNKNFIALVEEVGELAKDLLEDKASFKQEAIQVAVMAIRVLEEGDSDFTFTQVCTPITKISCE